MIPTDAEVVTTYAKLDYLLRAFAEGNFGLLVIVGPPGTGKTSRVSAALPHARPVRGGSTPYALYQWLYECRDLPVVLDDSDAVLRDKRGLDLLKTATEVRKPARVQWNSNTAEIRAGELPAAFDTRSRFVILANGWPVANPDLWALESRANMVYFAPLPAEVHWYAGEHLGVDEVHEFVGQHLHALKEVNLRLYQRARDRYAAGRRSGQPDEWKGYVRSQCISTETAYVIALLRDPTFKNHHQRAKEFERKTGKTARTFYRQVASLRATVESNAVTAGTADLCGQS